MIKPYYQDEHTTIYNCDCEEILPDLPKVDLVLTDPPYGIGAGALSFKNGTSKTNQNYCFGDWDKTQVKNDLMVKIIKKSTFSIVWGGNYYTLPVSKCWLVWDKETGKNSYADAELAWSNLPLTVQLRRKQWLGSNAKDGSVRVHPTQKPIEIMLWCISLSKESETILDPFMGSGTTLRAAKDLNKKAIGVEREEKYCEIAAERLQQEVLCL